MAKATTVSIVGMELGPLRQQRTAYQNTAYDTHFGNHNNYQVVTGLGKPQNRSVNLLLDAGGILLFLIAFALGISAVANKNFASWLGQKGQLVVIGFVLSVMGFINLKHAQALLLLLEQRFGQSLLQNYDAILRDNKLSPQTSFPIRAALIFLFALPLALSACYKQFIDGETSVTSANSDIIHFGPSGPPGLYAGGGRALFVNATSALYAGRIGVMTDDPPEDTSYGFNMHTINNTVTAMLDVPVHTNMSDLQRRLKPDQSLILSAAVNATFARLNSTPDSTERRDPDYWNNMVGYLGSKKLDGDTSPSSRRRPYGIGGYFEIYNAWADSSLVFMSYYNVTLKDTFYSKAMGFNIYRGTANAIWRISYNSIVLLHASNFDTDYSPATQYPERVGPNKCMWETTNPNSQKVIYCGWVSLGQDYDHEVPDYLLSQI